MFKRFLSIVAIASAISVSASAQLKVLNHLAADVSVGTTGIGVELSTPITPYLQLRAGLSVMPNFSFSTELNGQVEVRKTAGTATETENVDVEVSAGLKRTQGDIILNLYPFGSHGNFFIAGGVYFGGRGLVNIKGHSDYVAELQEQGRLEKGYVEVGSYHIDYSSNGNVYGGLAANKVRPYLGLGFGRPCPKGRLGCMFELGVQFMGKMKVCQGKNLDPIDMEAIKVNDDWQDWMDKLTVYPMLKFTITGRIL